MELKIKTFDELSVEELYKIYKLRTAVFVVEQNCPYQEVDDTDPEATHMWLEEDGMIKSYLRVFPVPGEPRRARIGRVIAAERRKGLATRLLGYALELCEHAWECKEVYIEAQTYARELYEKIGFVQVGEEFLDDGIPHIPMLYIVK